MILEVIVPEHQVKTVTKEKDSSSRNESRQKVMFQLGPSEKLAETESLNKLGESKSVVKIKKATHVSRESFILEFIISKSPKVSYLPNVGEHVPAFRGLFAKVIILCCYSLEKISPNFLRPESVSLCEHIA